MPKRSKVRIEAHQSDCAIPAEHGCQNRGTHAPWLVRELREPEEPATVDSVSSPVSPCKIPSYPSSPKL